MKKTWWIVPMILLMVSLSACSGAAAAQATEVPATTGGASASDNAGGQGGAQMGIETKLALGTLKLEGTNLAVTAEQAAELLPLWKAVKSLSSSDTASTDEISALYDQIQETMTAEQVQAITDLDLANVDMAALMDDLGIDVGSFPGGGDASVSDDTRATRMAQAQAQGSLPAGGGRADGGQMPFGGGMPAGGGDMAGGMAPGDFPDQGFAQGTPAAGQSTGRRGMGMTNLFVEPLIQLLAERAGR